MIILRMDFTAQASSPDAAIVSVMPQRKGSVLDAGKERNSLSASKWTDFLVKCHDSKLGSVRSLIVYVNSPARRNPANARQYAACRVACTLSAKSNRFTKRRSMFFVMGIRSFLSASPFFRFMLAMILFSTGW